MIRSFARGILLFCTTSLLLQPLHAQQDTAVLEAFSLKELLNVKVVTASKVSQSLAVAPATVIVITKEQIKLRGYQSLLDVMYDLPDVKVDDKVYSGIRNSFTVRGTQGSEKFVILLDGISISSPSGEAMPIMENYPVNLAEQIEVVYGPASALYGANALSGVINIITKKVSRKDVSAEVSVVGGSHGYSNTSMFLTKKLADDVQLVVSGQYSYDKGADLSRIYSGDSLMSVASYSTGTINTIFGPATPMTPIRGKYEAPIKAYNVYAALHAGYFNAAVFGNWSRLPTALGNNTLNALFNKDAQMTQSITMATASYKRKFNKLTTATILTASHYNLHPGTNYRNLYTAMEPAYKYSTNTMIRGEQQVDYALSRKLNFSSGIAYENYVSIPQSADLAKPVDRKGFLSGSYLGTAAYYRPEGLPAQFYFIKYYNVGGYLQTQYSPSRKLHITIGSRYDYNSRYGSTFNPRMGFVYNPAENTSIKVLYGSAYFAPAPSTSYVQYGSFTTNDSGRTYRSSFLHLPNPDLKPIVSDNLELNIRHSITKNLIITVGMYGTLMKGLYEFSDDNATTKRYNNSFNGIPVDYIEVFTNNNRQKNFGGSIQLNWKYSAGDFSVNSYASASYVDGLNEQGLTEKDENTLDRELDFIAKLMLRCGADVKFRQFSISPRLLLMGRQHITGLSDTVNNIIQRQSIAGYALLNVSMRWNVSKKVSVFANISNALDQRYRSVGFNMDLNRKDTDVLHGQPQDPIRVHGGVSLSF